MCVWLYRISGLVVRLYRISGLVANNYHVCHLLIVVPPKRGKQSAQRAQPYQTTVRKSARQVNHSVIPPRDPPESTGASQNKQSKQRKVTQPAEKDRAQPSSTQVRGNKNQPPQPQVIDHSVIIEEDNPSDNQQQGVSRSEFQTLKASMNSMRELFTSFVNNFSSSDNNDNHREASNLTPPQQSGIGVQPVTTQPSSSLNNDSNIGPPNTVSHSEDVVQRAIAAHVATMVGPQVSGPHFTGKQNESVSYQLDRKVNQTIIQEIWDEKYIDFSNLLEKSDDMEQGLIIKYAEPGEPLTLVPPKGKSQITSIKQWAQAFDIFHSIYSRKYPHQTHNLLTYAATVKDLAAQGGDYLRYDQEFRRARSRYGIPWEVPENIMWTSCSQTGLRNHINQVLADLVSSTPQPSFSSIPTTPQPSFQTIPTYNPPPTHTQTFPEATHNTPKLPKPQSFPAKSNTPNQPPNPGNHKTPKDPITNDDSKLKHPGGYCYQFHNKGKCDRDRCQYHHKCWVPGCGGEHSVYVCPNLARHFNIPGISNSHYTTNTKPTSNSN